MAADASPHASPEREGAAPAGPRCIKRLWIPLLALASMWALMLLPSRVLSAETLENHQFFFFQAGYFFGPMIAAAVFLLWWMFLSGVAWSTRFLGLGLIVGLGVVGGLVSDRSMVMALLMWGLPAALTACLVGMLFARRATPRMQLAAIAVCMALPWGYMALQRLDGIDGKFDADLSWRWEPKAEDEFLAERKAAKPADVTSSAPLEMQPGDWPGFRGPHRDSVAESVTFGTDWDTVPPKLKWRQRIGPGWSSFAVIGNRLFTQEQRGDVEAVVCYDADTGQELWAHTEKDRFEEAVAGPGPRATPTIDGDRLYALGANGLLVCLDAATGATHWTADIKKDSGAVAPQWGFSSSPLIVDGKALIHTGAKNGKSVLAYNTADGKVAWAAGEGGHSYCSLHLHEIDGVPQAVVCTENGVESFDPVTGKVLWHHEWEPTKGVARVVQPALFGGDRVIIGTGLGVGSRSVKVSHKADSWQVDEDWTTSEFKPYFNDFVIVGNHAYGFDGSIFCCVDLQTGQRAWKGGRYGNGQVLSLPAMNALLVLTERGEIALVDVTPEKLVERAKIEGIEGKTWNHPVIAHGKLFVRNGEEIACFELPPAASVPVADASAPDTSEGEPNDESRAVGDGSGAAGGP